MAEITFLMDRDPPGAANQFYGVANDYFKKTAPDVLVEAPAGGQTLEGVFDELRRRAATGPAGIFGVINIVTHATGFSSLEFGLTKAERGALLLPARLSDAVKAAETTTPILGKLGAPAVTDQTHVRLFGCDVGKDEAFLRNLGLMFGRPADIAAPVRVAVFRRSSAGKVTYRLARTWGVPWRTDIRKTADWPATRAAFIAKAVSKFATEAAQRSPGDLFAANPVTESITRGANASTAAPGPTFFFHESLRIKIPAGEPDPQAFVNTAKTVSSAVATGSEISDLTVKLTIGPPDFIDRSDPAAWVAHVAVLAEIEDRPVGFDNSDQYRKARIAPEIAPSTGPKPTGDGGAPPAPPAHSLWQQATEEFLAAGGSQDELDDLVAGLDDESADGSLTEPDVVVAYDTDADPVALPAPEVPA